MKFGFIHFGIAFSGCLKQTDSSSNITPCCIGSLKTSEARFNETKTAA